MGPRGMRQTITGIGRCLWFGLQVIEALKPLALQKLATSPVPLTACDVLADVAVLFSIYNASCCNYIFVCEASCCKRDAISVSLLVLFVAVAVLSCHYQSFFSPEKKWTHNKGGVIPIDFPDNHMLGFVDYKTRTLLGPVYTSF